MEEEVDFKQEVEATTSEDEVAYLSNTQHTSVVGEVKIISMIAGVIMGKIEHLLAATTTITTITVTGDQEINTMNLESKTTPITEVNDNPR